MQNFKLKIFITGIYRSGTTLISRILNNHSRLWFTFDSVHFMRFCYGRFNPIARAKNAERLVKEIYNRLLRKSQMKFDLNRAISELYGLKKIDYRAIYELIMGLLVLEYKSGVWGWGEKTNVCWGQIPNFLEMFPGGKTIHMLRDPRDIICSYREMTYEPGYSYFDSAFCSLDSFLRADEYRQRFNQKNYYLLRYEDLVQNPEKEVKNICNFLELKFEPKMLNVAGFTDKKGGRWSGNSSFGKRINTISKKPIGRWRKHASALEIFFVELINKQSMKKFGYTLSGIEIGRSDWIKLYKILNSRGILKQRYSNWLKRAEGIEAYPSDPLTR